MSSSTVVSVSNLGKAYRIGLKDEKKETLAAAIKDTLMSPFKNFKNITGLRKIDKDSADKDIFWANKNISFELKQGEVLGIIGKNGAGKSTLLKLLSRITEPSIGRIEIVGRVASLLEVGTGFNPELTGKENIYLNGTILGLTKKEIDKKFESIVEFSGIEKFIETPVKRYSSGMKVRLAFAVAAHLDPEILIIDEVLAVGDAEFQKKCLGKMQDVAGKEGRTILFVSHDLAAVKKLCSRAILLEHGQIIKEGETNEVIDYYLQGSGANNNATNDWVHERGNQNFMFTGYELLNDKKEKVVIANLGQDLEIVFNYTTKEKGAEPVVILNFRNNLEQVLFTCISRDSYAGVMKLNNEGTISCLIPKLPLLPGIYSIDVTLKYANDITDEIHSAITLEVERGDFFGTGKMHAAMLNGLIAYHTWDVK